MGGRQAERKGKGGGTHQDLVKEVLNELLLQRTTRQESVKIRSEELGDKVDILEGGNENVGEGNDVFVLDMLEEFELSVSTLGEDGSTFLGEKENKVS